MAKPSAFANYFNFNGGIQTDMSPLNIKPHECLDMENIYIENDGSLRRFKGVDVFSSEFNTFSKADNDAVETFYWETYNENGLFRHYLCVLSRKGLALFDPYIEYLTDSPVKEFIFEEELAEDYDYDLDGVRIIIANANSYPFYIYLDENDNLKKEVIPMFIRDLTFDPTEHDDIVDEIKSGDITDDDEPTKIRGITVDNERLHYYDDLMLKGFKKGQYPSTVACFSGRIFLGSYLENASTVYFSQVLKTFRDYDDKLLDAYTKFGYADIKIETIDYTKFFTENPSWSLIDPSVVASDGGYAKITGLDRMLKIAGFKDSLYVFARNGVWRIFGRDGIFAANDYGIQKLTNAGLISKKAMCFMENSPAYASDNGIYVIQADQMSGELTSFSLSENKIDKLYNNIPNSCKELSRMSYNRNEKLLYYLYNSDMDKSLDHKIHSRYGDCLIYNSKIKAWFKRTMAKEETPSFRIANLFYMPFQEISNSYIIIDNNDNEIVTNLGDTVVTSYGAEIEQNYRTFVTLDRGNTEYTFGFFEGNYLYDFYNLGEEYREHYSSYLTSAYQLFEDLARKKQLPYIHILFKRLETGTQSPLGIDNIPCDAMLRVSLGFTSTPYLVNDEFGQIYIKNANYGKARYIYPKKRPKYDLYKDYNLFTNRILGRGKILQFHITNRRDERAFECLADNITSSPLLDTTNWIEIDYDKTYSHWTNGTVYNTGDKVKVEIEYDFQIVGWTCNLMANKNSSGGSQ